MTKPEPPAPESVPYDSLLLSPLGPFEDWAVIKKSLPRKKSQELRDLMWADGLYPRTPMSTFDGNQWRSYEADWTRRIIAHVTEWSFVEGDDGQTGPVLPIKEESIDLLPDLAYQQICKTLNDMLSGKFPEDAKSETRDDAAGERVVRGSEDASGDTASVTPQVQPNGYVGQETPAPLA